MDNEKLKSPSIVATSFPGQFSDVSDQDIVPGGNVLQLNCFSMKQGELQTRGGLIEVILSTLDE